VNGILVVNKPSGWTSHDVVNKVKKSYKLKKVGHAGTLDPNATGVLVLCIGAATRFMRYLNTDPKEYEGEMILGVRTDTLDITGKFLSEEATNVTLEQVKQAINKLQGKIEQIPPMVSAVKVNGTPLYVHARQGREIEREPRKVEIYRFEIIDMMEDTRQTIRFKVVCSKGTYVRALCDDVGETLGCGACLGDLVRTKSGSYCLEQALSMDEIAELGMKKLPAKLVSLKVALDNYQKIIIKAEYKNKVLNGNFITCEMFYAGNEKICENEIVCLLDSEENILGLAKAKVEISKESVFEDGKVIARPICIIPDFE